MSLVYGNLFTIGPNNTFVPGLATRYSFSNDNKTFTLNTRTGVTFQDGTPFNATAVALNLTRDSAKTSGCLCLTALKNATSITAPNDHTVVMNFSVPDGVILATLSTSPATYIISPAALSSQGSNYGATPVGAGPYKVVSDIIDSTITLGRWPGYWDARATHVSQITVTSETTGASGLASVQSGGAQIFDLTSDPATQKAAKQSGLNIETEHISGNFLYMDFNTAPFNNKLAREAMQYATNAKALDSVLYYGYGPASETLIGPQQIAYFGSTLPGYRSYKLKKAKQLVSQLGGLSFTLISIGTTPTAIAEMEAVQKQWAQAGIQVTLDPLTLPAGLKELESGTYQAVIAGYPAQDDSPLTLATSLVCPVYFSPGFCDPTVTRYAEQALQTKSFTAQATLMKKAVTLAVVNDAAYVPLNSTPGSVVLTKNVHNFVYEGGALYLSGVWLS
ncbi:MAG TPA: ABC transporter substrate-binding protein [Acidimicrobiales bacterium]